MVGLDLLDVGRFARACPGPACRFAQLVFTRRERRRYGATPARLALCFSAKEAVAKALGTGLTIGAPPGVNAPCIEILAGPTERTARALLHGAAWAAARRQGFRRVAVSWSRRGDLVLTCALGVRGGAASPRSERDERG